MLIPVKIKKCLWTRWAVPSSKRQAVHLIWLGRLNFCSVGRYRHLWRLIHPMLRQESKISGVNHPLSHIMTLIEIRVNNLFGMSGAGFSQRLEFWKSPCEVDAFLSLRREWRCSKDSLCFILLCRQVSCILQTAD